MKSVSSSSHHETATSNESTTPASKKNPAMSSLIAGIGSGTLSSIVCAPLDLVRTRMQVAGDLNQSSKMSADLSKLSIRSTLRDIVATDGIQGCFRGLGPTLATVPAFWGIYFPVYEHMKVELTQRWGNDVEEGGNIQSLIHMTSAIGSGAVADLFCNPMFVVRTRMQTEALHVIMSPQNDGVRTQQNGIIQTVKGLYVEGGVPIFWRGLTASLLGLSHVGIQFPVYEKLKSEARKRSPTNVESPFDLLLSSGLSKMIATTLTYPHEVVRSRMMDYRCDGNAASNGLVATCRRIIKNEGWGALYTGIHVSMLRVVPNCCITFVTYEMILRWLT